MRSSPSFILGRQPILDRTFRTVAYELLFRSTEHLKTGLLNDRMATSSVISHAFVELGIDATLGKLRGYINFDAELLMSDVVELLPVDRTTIELLETIDITPEVVERCRQLRERGFKLALDDMVHMTAAHEALLPLLDVVKIDVLGASEAAVADLVSRARRAGVKTLAEKVETSEQALWCQDLGFDYFQGYFFARPVILKGRRSDPSKQVLVNLLQQSMSNADRTAIEQTFKQSPELAFKLMRLVNSVGMGMRRKIQSLHHALVVLGSRQLQRWIQVLLFAHHSSGTFPTPLLTMAVTRGKLLELLAERESGEAEYRDRAFMAGILSLMDALLGAPMQEVIEQLHLHDEVREALLHRQGRLGRLLLIAEALERGDQDAVAGYFVDSLLCRLEDVPALQVEAMRWSDNIGESGADDDSPAQAPASQLASPEKTTAARR